MKLSYEETQKLKKDFRRDNQQLIQELEEVEEKLQTAKEIYETLQEKYDRLKAPLLIYWKQDVHRAEDAKQKLHDAKIKYQEENDLTDEWRDLQTKEM